MLLDALKGQINALNLILLTALFAYIMMRRNKRKTGIFFAVVAISFFLLFSTSYLPQYLVGRLESRFMPFNKGLLQGDGKRIYIHVLGGGYNPDKRLPAQEQLSLVGLGRLAEGIRLSRLYDNSILVVSGHIASGSESLASVTKRAAVCLGVAEERVKTLEEPSTTLAEAEAFKDNFGADHPVIVVTDAVHMARAIKFFRNQGLEPLAAPANFLVNDSDTIEMGWIPSAGNLLLMDRVLREFFGWIKAMLFWRN